MRLIRQFAASAGLSVALLGAAGLGGLALTTATAGPALAAAANPIGASASADPDSASPGSHVTFQVFCATLDTSSATFFGTTIGLPERIPMDKEPASGVFSLTVTLPRSIAPGSYAPEMDCSDGSTATTTLTVTVTTMPARGGAATGDGTTSTQTNTGLAAGGLALIAAGAAVGGIALRRRGPARRS
jgi:hypothetical protein